MENTTPMTPKGLPAEVEAMLNTRLGDEYTAYYFYRNAANWCSNVNYKKAAAFFEKEAAGELGHAQGLQDYLIQWNHIPAIPQVPTQVNFVSLVDIINQAYDIEYALLGKYSEDQKKVFSIDPGTFNFIQKYVDYQVDEVKEYSDLLNAAVLVDTNNKFEVLYFEQTYF
jgi:ferritin